MASRNYHGLLDEDFPWKMFLNQSMMSLKPQGQLQAVACNIHKKWSEDMPATRYARQELGPWLQAAFAALEWNVNWANSANLDTVIVVRMVLTVFWSLRYFTRTLQARTFSEGLALLSLNPNGWRALFSLELGRKHFEETSYWRIRNL